MDINLKPLNGIYTSGRQFVTVCGKTSREQLDKLSFGNNLENAFRKEPNKRGPADKQLIESLASGDNETNPLIVFLTLHEAFFLIYSLGWLRIQAEDESPMSIELCWQVFRNYNFKSNINLDFAIEFGVYHYFKTRNWIVKPGTNYGTNFLLYKDDPTISHAQYSVLIIYDEVSGHSAEGGVASSSYSWESLLTFYRVTQSVSKQLLLVYVKTNDNAPGETKFTYPSCIGDMRITTRLFISHSSMASYINKSETLDI